MKAVLKFSLNRRPQPTNEVMANGFLPEGSVIDVVETVQGKLVDGIATWHKASDGFFYWGGGVEDVISQPSLIGQQQIKNWGIDFYNIPEIWKEYTGRNVKVAVLDSGIESSHPDLMNGIIKTADHAFNTSKEKDIFGHGTHCAGIIGARNNNLGIVGIAHSCNMYLGKIINDEIGIDPVFMCKGIEWAIQEQVDVISMSVGIDTNNEDLEKLIIKTHEKNILIVAAGGNNVGGVNLKDVLYPAKYENCIAVGAINKTGTYDAMTVFSERIDLLAPGIEIFSTTSGAKGFYMNDSGTSMAAAFVSGIIALGIQKLKMADKQVSATGVKNILLAACDQIKVTIENKEIAFKVLNPQKFIFSL